MEARGHCTVIGQCRARTCLDQDATVAAIRDLKQGGITTIVVGFGAETASGPGPAVLQAMAAQGGFQRRCRRSTECGSGDSCNLSTGECGRQYFQAANGTELGDALEQIRKRFEGDICVHKLIARPTTPRLIAVLIDGSDVPPGGQTWRYTDQPDAGVLDVAAPRSMGPAPTVVFAEQGSICPRLRAATEDSPVNVEIRVIEAL